MFFKKLFTKKSKKVVELFRYDMKPRQNDVEQYTDDLKKQVEKADLSVDELIKAMEWLTKNPAYNSDTEYYFIYTDKYSYGLEREIEVAHFCGADEFARLNGALQMVINENS